MTTEEFGQYMRGLRKEQKLSLRAASSDAGVSITYICQIEKGDKKPSAEILKKLAPVYGVPIQDILKEAGYFEEPKVEMSDLERLMKLKPIDHVQAILKRGMCPLNGWNEKNTVEPVTCALVPTLKGETQCTAEDFKKCPLVKR